MRLHHLPWLRLAVLAGLCLAVLGPPPAANARTAATLPAGFVDEFLAHMPFPTALASTPDGRLLVTTQTGQLWVYQEGQPFQPVLDLGPLLCANRERGLSGVAVDPNYAANHFIYLYYTFNQHGVCPDKEPTNPLNPVNRVGRFTLLDNNEVLTASQVVVLDNIVNSYGIHNGGDLHFGADGLLYIATGDGAGPNGAYVSPRLLSHLAGKILRIAPNGSIPLGNPYAAAPDSRRCGDPAGLPAGSGPCQEVFAYGLRNPFRLAFRPGTNEFYINDVGQAVWEEINLGALNADYGWNVREGPCPFSQPSCNPANTSPGPYTAPIHYYPHSVGCNAITGGAFVPAGVWPAEYDGAYLFGDFGCGRIWRLVGSGSGSSRVDFADLLHRNSLVAMRFAPYQTTQALYYTSYAGVSTTGLGQLRRIRYTGQTNQAPVAVLTADQVYGGTAPLTVTLSAAGSADPDAGDTLVYDWDLGDGTVLTGTTSLTQTHVYPAGVYTATLRVRDQRAGVSDPATLRLDSGNTPPLPVLERVGGEAPFAVGELLGWEGAAIDPEDGEVLTLTWEARLHHLDAMLPGNAHFHPYLPPTAGSAISVTAPAPEDFGATALSFLEVRLTATDSWGLSAVVTQAVLPRLVTVQVETEPVGLRLLLNGQAVQAPHTATSWDNWAFTLQTPLQTDPAGARWGWAAWESGEALTATRTITTPAMAASYTATLAATSLGPVPVVNALTPAEYAAGLSEPLTLTVTGQDFASDAQVLWAGNALTTTQFISSTQVEAWVPAEWLEEAGTLTVRVLNPEPGGGTSDALSLKRWWRVWVPWAKR